MSSYGISTEYTYQEFSLDSYDNSGPANVLYTPQNWPRFELGGKQPLKNVVGIQIVSAEIPFSYYIFTVLNGTFYLQENGGALLPIVIPPGNYYIANLTSTLSSLLTAASGVGGTYVVTIDTTTNKLSFVGSGGTLTDFILTFGNVGSTGNFSTRLNLGFPGGPTASTGLTLVAPNVVNLSGPNYLYFNSQKIGTLMSIDLPTGSSNLGGGNSSVQICRVPINAQPGETIFYKNPNPDFWFNVGDLETFQILDLYISIGNLGFSSAPVPVDLNGLGFSVVLGVLQRNSFESLSQGGTFDQNRVSKRARPY